MFKNMRLVILFDMLLNPSFKMTTNFANIARTTASTLFENCRLVRRLKSVAMFIQTSLSFVLSRKIINPLFLSIYGNQIPGNQIPSLDPVLI